MTSSDTYNPLCDRRADIPFQSCKVEHIEPAIEVLLTEAEAELARLQQPSTPLTFETTMRALDSLGLRLSYAVGLISHLESVATTPAWRESYNRILPKVTAFRSKVVLDPDVWRTLTTYAATPEAATLTGEHRRYLTKTLDAFRRNGADLPPDQKAELAALNTELAEITNTFSQHVLDATNAFEFVTTNESELRGLPASAIQMGRASAEAKGLSGWRFTLQGPSYLAIMTYLDDRTIRERFYRAQNSRCAAGEFENISLLYRILDLRRKKATMLGFKDYADFVLHDRMAKNGERASSFVEELKGRIAAQYSREQEELFTFIKEHHGLAKDELQPWDLPYFAEKMRKALYDFDEEELRPYFALPRVMEGLFTIVEKTFGFRVTANPELQTWDPSVQAFSVFDSATQELVGYFYADLHPRETKRGGAWMDGFITHVVDAHDTLPHVGLIAGNFTPPQDGKAALLTHDEVTTLFHEFGHLMHQLASRTEMRSLSMDGVAWDFIELPSQILENWCWERESLDLFARHVESGATIPEELFQKVMRARNFRSATFLTRQLSFSTVDLSLHRSYDRSRDGEVLPYCRGIFQQLSPITLPDDFAMIASFTHLFSSPVGYAAGYYSYQWAEVLDADAFSRFKHEGLLRRDVGIDFREKVLSRGDTRDPDELFRSFMGRDPDMTALLERSGLA